MKIELKLSYQDASRYTTESTTSIQNKFAGPSDCFNSQPRRGLTLTLACRCHCMRKRPKASNQVLELDAHPGFRKRKCRLGTGATEHPPLCLTKLKSACQWLLSDVEGWIRGIGYPMTERDDTGLERAVFMLWEAKRAKRASQGTSSILTFPALFASPNLPISTSLINDHHVRSSPLYLLFASTQRSSIMLELHQNLSYLEVVPNGNNGVCPGED
ncbi:uncharacterized protein BDR25DRAFT_349554 [Lindgomyces ingoldianus]|uniref:Uncharacterized protein n=1 Tax=Lindgomyces ingoldianus TaxID=673940 RepID=A0ACB6RDA9_9PLEO|nr:uncharacterized protein BDR25DRAFT_349554 [Lindgomyces ingoldianus]KAF2476466.1 hypothetical protein BDR25DRAFT_349554 [Lindgomyces ingoldianus]